MNPSVAEVATPLQHALDGFATAFDHLVKVVDDGGLTDLDAGGLISFAQAFESVRNRMPIIDNLVAATGVEHEVPRALCQRSMTRVLSDSLSISPVEAARRVRAAEHLCERRSMTGETIKPRRVRLALAQRDGEISAEKVSIIDAALREVDGRGFDPGDVEAGERLLADAARSLKPAELRVAARRVVDSIDPDGTLPNDQVQQDRRFFRLRKAADGSWRGEFRLVPAVGEKLRAILDPLAAPRTGVVPDGRCGDAEEGSATAAADGMDATGAGSVAARRGSVEVDPRTRDQRCHDALEDVCDRILRAGSVPDSGGTPCTVIVTIGADVLASRSGYGFCSDGSPIPASTVIGLADQADLGWCVTGSRGAVLAMGRSSRLATKSQTLALIARDGGCSFPGCDIPPEWCERHHVVPWVDGGKTDLTNLTLLCSYHHHNFEQRGWSCRVNLDQLPEWTPPKWVDRQQRPIVNPRIRVRHWNPALDDWSSGQPPDLS